MSRIPNRLKLKTTPLANSDMIVKGDRYRFTLLDHGLIRMEYSEDGQFEDRATQVVTNRSFPKFNYKIEKENGQLSISTDTVKLIYSENEPFNYETLSVQFLSARSASYYRWHYGEDISDKNLKGTVRTLDNVDGEIPLGDGLMALGGFSVLDDSKSFIFAEDGWIEPRKKEIDIYLFAYFNEFKTVLKRYYSLTGNTPLLPRYALGNMWSRYYAYTQQEYLDLMDRFKREECPFSVAVIDMDWHLTDVDPQYGTGWTGYTWNKKLFPDYQYFLEELGKKGLKTTLNLHPADGVRNYEKQYPELAEAMGITDGSAVEFEIDNPDYLDKYFKVLHHPYEKDGVTFWWMDWQQGARTKTKGLDPLWMLNHFHNLDLQRDGKRGLMLSRYAGLGSHRYPIGFSGDTYMTWDSLKFQPYFTLTATNVGYTWWSHDIGGHMNGYRDDELTTRWVQFGVFSPICRLHSETNPMSGKEPWNYNEMAEKTMKRFLKLRHELVPYLYTINYQNYKYFEALVTPMYYNYPDKQEAYEHKNEYFFGSEMLVNIITKPSDKITTMGYCDTYIPEGIWFDFFNGLKYEGEKTLRTYRGLSEIPVLVKAGGIVPMDATGVHNSVDNPESLKIRVFAGRNNSFEMYEDDGETLNYKEEKYQITKFEIIHGLKPIFTIYKGDGDNNLIPQNRNFEIEFNGYTDCNSFTVMEDGKLKNFEIKKDSGKISVIIKNVSGNVEIRFDENVDIIENNKSELMLNRLMKFQCDNNYRRDMYNLIIENKPITDFLIYCNKNRIDENVRDCILEIYMA